MSTDDLRNIPTAELNRRLAHAKGRVGQLYGDLLIAERTRNVLLNEIGYRALGARPGDRIRWEVHGVDCYGYVVSAMGRDDRVISVCVYPEKSDGTPGRMARTIYADQRPTPAPKEPTDA